MIDLGPLPLEMHLVRKAAKRLDVDWQLPR